MASMIDYTLDAGKLGDLDCLVAYWYEAAEEPTRTSPGWPMTLEVHKVMYKGQDITWLVAETLENDAQFLQAIITQYEE